MVDSGLEALALEKARFDTPKEGIEQYYVPCGGMYRRKFLKIVLRIRVYMKEKRKAQEIVSRARAR